MLQWIARRRRFLGPGQPPRERFFEPTKTNGEVILMPVKT